MNDLVYWASVLSVALGYPLVTAIIAMVLYFSRHPYEEYDVRGNPTPEAGWEAFQWEIRKLR